MITAIIIDDEAGDRLAVEQMLQTYCPEVQVPAKAADRQGTIISIEKHKTQLRTARYPVKNFGNNFNCKNY